VDNTSAVAVLHLWGVSVARVPRALTFMAVHRGPLRRTSGLQFWKLLGTGSGSTFTLRDSDPRHWGLLTVWPHLVAAREFEQHRVVRQWQQIAQESLRIELHPLASKGSWSGKQPFECASAPTDHSSGPIAAITRARIKPGYWRRFAAAVPAVAADLRQDPALRFSIGIGEAPIGLQGTFSIWSDAKAIAEFAYRRNAHAAVVTQTHQLQWYAEEMFARFQLGEVSGTYRGQPVNLESP